MKKIIWICLFLFIGSAQAAVYKWVDENGKVHYGDKPQAGNKNIELNVDSEPSVVRGMDSSRVEKREKLLEVMEEDRIEKREANKKKKQKAARNKKRCHYQKDKLRRFKRASAIYNLDSDGNRVYQSRGKRERTIASIQKKINKYCR